MSRFFSRQGAMHRSIFHLMKNARDRIQSRRYSNRLWNRYSVVARDNPLATKSFVAGFLFLTSDVLCQSLFGVDEYDFWRTVRFTLVGAGFTPSVHTWYAFLSRRFVGTTLLPTLQRLALDQIVFAPLFIPAFFGANLLLQGQPRLIATKIQDDWASTVIVNYVVWVPAQFINFRFVPQIHQVLFSNCVGFFWNIYMSTITHKEEKSNVVNVLGLVSPSVEPSMPSRCISDPLGKCPKLEEEDSPSSTIQLDNIPLRSIMTHAPTENHCAKDVAAEASAEISVEIDAQTGSVQKPSLNNTNITPLANAMPKPSEVKVE